MIDPTKPILDDTHLHQIKNALEVLDHLERHLDTATRAGIDVTQARAEAVESRKKLLAVKNAYFPNR